MVNAGGYVVDVTAMPWVQRAFAYGAITETCRQLDLRDYELPNAPRFKEYRSAQPSGVVRFRYIMRSACLTAAMASGDIPAAAAVS